MALLRWETTPNELKDRLADVVRDANGMEFEQAYFWENKHLYPGYKQVPAASKTYYYLSRAEDRGTLEDVWEYMDPLAVGVKAVSRDRNHDHWVHFYFCDITRVRMLAKGSDVLIGGAAKPTFEFWTDYCEHEHTHEMYREEVRDRVQNWTV